MEYLFVYKADTGKKILYPLMSLEDGASILYHKQTKLHWMDTDFIVWLKPQRDLYRIF